MSAVQPNPDVLLNSIVYIEHGDTDPSGTRLLLAAFAGRLLFLGRGRNVCRVITLVRHICQRFLPIRQHSHALANLVEFKGEITHCLVLFCDGVLGLVTVR